MLLVATGCCWLALAGIDRGWLVLAALLLLDAKLLLLIPVDAVGRYVKLVLAADPVRKQVPRNIAEKQTGKLPCQLHSYYRLPATLQPQL